MTAVLRPTPPRPPRLPKRVPGEPVLPVRPLLELIELSHPEWDPADPDRPSATVVLALRAGVHRRQVDRWRHEGLTYSQADEVAIRAGWHPALVWPDEW